MGQRGDHGVQVFAENDQHDGDADEGDDGEELEAAAEEARRQGESHVGAKVPGSGARGQVSGGQAPHPGHRALDTCYS